MPKLDTLGMSTIVKVAATWAEAVVAATEVCGLHAFSLACILYFLLMMACMRLFLLESSSWLAFSTYH